MMSEDQLSRLIGTLETSARQIDVTFARAGERLGEGLTLFEGLKERLSLLSGELSGSEIARAGTDLTRLAAELKRLSASLSGETGALRSLAGHSGEASQALERLLTHMRLITILARGARIESVSVQTAGRDFGDFTNEILALTTQAQRTVEACARDHDRLSSMLGAALAAQRDFEGRYGMALAALAGKLELTLAEVALRQQKSLALTQDAAVHSGKIAMAAGGAIIALQSGDSIRQRLEHAIAGLRIVVSLRGNAGSGAGLSAAERAAAEPVLRRLEAAQLHASATTLAGDADAIEQALALLAGDTATLIELVHSLYGGADAKSASFLQNLESELAEASELLGKCDIARAGVDRVTAALATVLQTCQQTVSALADTVSSIVLIGMNAGLRAARLGSGGRSLVIIAQELKLAADDIAADAERLTPTFDAMQAAAASLSGADKLDAAHFAALDETMRRSLDIMRQTGDRLGKALDQLTREGRGFSTVVAEARLSFSNAGATSDLIASGADQLTAGALEQRLDDGLADAVRRILQEQVWPSYTMTAERTIHLAVLEECGIAAATPQAAAKAPAETKALDEFLF
jgi:HPt (histidine-containing phosphotransfer) domain-containing protein